MKRVPSEHNPAEPAAPVRTIARNDPPPDDGVDATLVRWTLSLSPRERLELLQANADALVRLRDAARSSR